MSRNELEDRIGVRGLGLGDFSSWKNRIHHVMKLCT
jgi:hypothetical protein